MSGELERRPAGTSLPDKIAYAQALAGSNLLPAQYREKPANLLFALEYAEALGVLPITAITSIHVIEGKPSASADLIASMIRKAGHKLRIKGDDTYAEATLIRADDPDFPYVVRWDEEKATKAGLWGKAGNWAKYPSAMLRARAITEVGRAGASEALMGVIYTPEELGAEVDADGVPIITTAAPAPRQAQARALHVVSDQGPAVPAEDPQVKAEADAEWLERITSLDSAEDARALYREAKEVGQLRRPLLVIDGEVNAVAELHEWITLRVAALPKPEQPAQAPAADTGEGDDVSQPATSGDDVQPDEEDDHPVDPLARAEATVAASGLTDTPAEGPIEGEVLDKPKAPPVEDPADMCRNTAQRKAVIAELVQLYGGNDAALAAIEDEFGVHADKVSTKRLRDLMTREQQANRAS